MTVPGWLPPVTMLVGAALFLFGVGDLEWGHQLGRDQAVGFIERGAELAAGVGIFAAGVRVPPPGGPR